MAADIVSIVEAFSQFDIDGAKIIADAANSNAGEQKWRPQVHTMAQGVGFH